MTNTGYPYNRIIQWAAGPVSIGAGLAAAWLAQKIGLVASHQDQVVHDLTELGMFGVGAVVTYAAHHKWFSNLAHYFFSQELPDVDRPGKAEGAKHVEWTPPTPEEEAEARAALGGDPA